MKIGVITQYFPSPRHPWDGRSAYQTIRELAKLADVKVFCPVMQYPRWLPGTASRRPAADPAWQPEGVKAEYFDWPLLPFVSRPLNGLVVTRAVRSAVRAFHPDALLSYYIYPSGTAAVALGRELRIPSVLTAIGSDLNRVEDAISLRRVRRTLAGATITTTVSRDLAGTAIAMGAPAARTVAILNGCDTSVFHPRDQATARAALDLDPAHRIVLYAGRFDLRKGLGELTDAVVSLHRERPQVHAYLLGSGPDEAILRSAIASHSASEYIHLVPPVHGDGVSTWIAASDLFTLPSYMEGCPNVVIEALACGRPVVATRVGGIPELMDDTCGRLVPPRDAPALARALAETLDHPWSQTRIAAAHHRSWTDVAHDVCAVLERARAASPTNV